jgi:flagellar biogenesis protein FliO
VSFLAEIWAVIVSTALTWFEHLDNASLDKIVSLLTILAISIGLVDWTLRKFRNRAEKKEKRRNDIISAIEGIPKPFKAVDMLENPMGAGEKIGSTIEKITERFKQMKIKKFFKFSLSLLLVLLSLLRLRYTLCSISVISTAEITLYSGDE